MHANKSNPELMKELETVADLLEAPEGTAGGRSRKEVAELMRSAALRLSAMNITGGIADVIFERERQQEQERFTADHDDQHIGGELAIAAACYLNPNPRHTNTGVPVAWPWSDDWWKPAADPRMDTPADYRRRLVKGTALAIAEIDRFDRSAAQRHVEG